MIHGRDAQAMPLYDSPAELHLAEVRGAISVALRELAFFRERASHRPELWLDTGAVEYFEAMRAHLVVLRRRKAEAKELVRQWRAYHDNNKPFLRTVNAAAE